jgi:uncharacterized membrane protein YgcG
METLLVAPNADDPGSLEELRRFSRKVLKSNIEELGTEFKSRQTAATTAMVMSIAMFAIGLAGVVATLIRGFTASSVGESLSTIGIAGLSVGAFVTIFLLKPVETIERSEIFGAWLTVAMNTYWTRLMELRDPGTIDKDLESAAKDTADILSAIADKYAAAMTDYHSVLSPPATSGTTGGSGDGAGGAAAGSGAGGGGSTQPVVVPEAQAEPAP